MADIAIWDTISIPKTTYKAIWGYHFFKRGFLFEIGYTTGEADKAAVLVDWPTRKTELIFDFEGNIAHNFNLFDPFRGKFISGYGSTKGKICGTTDGAVWDVKNPYDQLCICDGSTNCNLTSNIDRCYIDQQTQLYICGGADGSKHIVVIDPDSGTVKFMNHPYAVDRGRFNIIPLYQDEILFAITKGASGYNGLLIGRVKIDDIVNAQDGTDITTLQSYESIYQDDNVNGKDRFILNGAGYYAIVHLDDRTLIIDKDLNVNQVCTDSIEIVGIGDEETFYGIKSPASGQVTLVKITPSGCSDVKTITSSISNPFTFRGKLSGFSDGTNGSTSIEIYSILDDNGAFPILLPDYINNKFRGWDIKGQKEWNGEVLIAQHRLLIPVTMRGLSFPLSDTLQKVQLPYQVPKGYSVIPLLGVATTSS